MAIPYTGYISEYHVVIHIQIENLGACSFLISCDHDKMQVSLALTIEIAKNCQTLATQQLSSPTKETNGNNYEKRPPPKPPPSKDLPSLRYCVVNLAFVLFQVCDLFLSSAYFKVALKVFVERPQICLAEGKVLMRENLIMDVANQFFLSTRQSIPSQMMILFNLKNLYNRTVRSKAKEMIRNGIDIKIVVPKLSSLLWKNSVWLFGLKNGICNTLLVSNFSMLMNVQIFVGLVFSVSVRMWMGNVPT
ncbi:uncharacterized protein LOC131643055 [Vicia villosa]|uniref:uncharacterized protein LOC131643055 n=1 Tax=Vicia villosa TaxID=3911 RepID=UPI00273C6934|nr:uncharacterized protein LOC131643055 [Vicia villosa]